MSAVGRAFSSVGMGLVCLSLASCDDPQPPEGLSMEEFETMWAWLSCDECNGGELDSLLAMRNRGETVEFMSHYLRDSTSTPFRHMRERLQGAYTSIQPSSMTEAEFVDHFMANFRAMVRTRSAVALAHFELWDTLRLALASADAWDFREDERSEFQRTFLTGTSGLTSHLDSTSLSVAWSASLPEDPPPPAVFRCAETPAAFSPPQPGRCYTYDVGPLTGWSIQDNGVERMYSFSGLLEGVYEVRSAIPRPDSTVLVLLLATRGGETIRFAY